MMPSEALYGRLPRSTYTMQLGLFTDKKRGALAVLDEIRKDYDCLDTSPEQIALDALLKKVQKAIIFCDAQIAEAKEMLDA